MLALLKDNEIECLGEVPPGAPAVAPPPAPLSHHPPHHYPSPLMPPISMASAAAMDMMLTPAVLPSKKPRPEKIYKCPSCDKSFSQLGNLKTHQNIHNPIKPYQCKVCQRSFAQQSTLLQHMRLHTGEKPYKCKLCNKDFTQSSHLQQHLRTHTGERPFKCTFCDKDFAQRSTLNQHTLTHTGIKLFICPHCNKSFAQASHLNQHVRRHTGEKPYKCYTCLKEFTQSSNLVQHMRTHTGEKPYHCSLCNRNFAQCSHLNQHMRNKHEGKTPTDESHGNRRNKLPAVQYEALNRFQQYLGTSVKGNNSSMTTDGYQPNFYPPFNQLTSQQQAPAAAALTSRSQQDSHQFTGPGSPSHLGQGQSIRNSYPHDKPMEMSLFHHFTQSNYFNHHIRDPFAYPPDGYLPNHIPLSYTLRQYFIDSQNRPGDASQGSLLLNPDNKDILGKVQDKSQTASLSSPNSSKQNKTIKSPQELQLHQDDRSYINHMALHNGIPGNHMTSPDRLVGNHMTLHSRSEGNHMNLHDRSRNNHISPQERLQANNMSPQDRSPLGLMSTQDSPHGHHMSPQDMSHTNHMSPKEITHGNQISSHSGPHTNQERSATSHMSSLIRSQRNHMLPLEQIQNRSHLVPQDMLHNSQHLSPQSRSQGGGSLQPQHDRLQKNHLSPQEEAQQNNTVSSQNNSPSNHLTSPSDIIYHHTKDTQQSSTDTKSMNSDLSPLANSINQSADISRNKPTTTSAPVQLLKVPQYGSLSTNTPLLVPQYDPTMISNQQHNHYQSSNHHPAISLGDSA